MTKVTKALIPAAGFGTRFLPQTKAMPKEMMPLVDKPVIQHVVEELVDAGIETIVIVTGLYKRAIEDHFDSLFELEEKLIRAGKEKEFEEVRKISDLAQFVYIRQKGPPGNATPILNAKAIMGNDPFIVFWGDDFFDCQPSRAKQLIKAYEKYNATIISGAQAKNEEDYKKYGFASGSVVDNSPFTIKVDKIIEKPGTKTNSPSNLFLSGFLATADIYEGLEKARTKLEPSQELVWTVGIESLIERKIPVYAIELKDAVFRDMGNKLEYLKTVIEYALNHPELGEDFKNHLISKIEDYK